MPSPLFCTGHSCLLPVGPTNSHCTLPEPVLVTAFASTVNSVGDCINVPLKINLI